MDETIAGFINVGVYLVSAIFFVIISKKCFWEKFSIPKGILTFLISPPAGYLYAYLLTVEYFGDHALENINLLMAYIGGLAVLQLGIQGLSMLIYVKLMKAPNASMPVFIYLSSIILIPGLTYMILANSALPGILYLTLHVLYYWLTIRPVSKITRSKQITNAKLFVALPITTFVFNSIMYALFIYTMYLTQLPDEYLGMFRNAKENMGADEYLQLLDFVRIFRDYLYSQQDIILYPCIFIAVVQIVAFYVIVRNIQYMNKAIEAQKVVKELSVEVMEALAHTIDAKDEYTKGHSIRVAKYSRMIARKMGLTEEHCESIYYMGLLHDLGKIGVPNEIINKPDRLTDEEYDVIKKHPGTGSGILEEIKTRPDLVIGARWHHERYDGTGYPDHKKGEEIPLEARIIAVADSYDAMTSNRSYRTYLPQNTVRKELEAGFGKQFDEKIAGIMIEIIDEDKDYLLHE